MLGGFVAEWLVRRPESAIAHTLGETFANLCGEATSSRHESTWHEIRERFRKVDLLALDGLETISRVPPAIEELTHTLDDLENRGAVVVVTSRTSPSQWLDWPKRLVDRLLGGLAVRINPPGPALRRRFLLEQARLRDIRLKADAVEALADSADGFRTLDGWLSRLALAARVERRPLDWEMVQPFLLDEAEAPPPAPPIEAIAQAVAIRFGVSLRDLRGAGRQPQFVEPRHLAIFLSRVYTKQSFVAIGRFFGGRDAATIRHAVKAAETRITDDPSLASTVEALTVKWQRINH
jgi:chromosomal replication initiator protein